MLSHEHQQIALQKHEALLRPDGVVGGDDILLVLMNYGLGGPTGDLDEDGDVDVVDLLLIIGFFGPCP